MLPMLLILVTMSCLVNALRGRCRYVAAGNSMYMCVFCVHIVGAWYVAMYPLKLAITGYRRTAAPVVPHAQNARHYHNPYECTCGRTAEDFHHHDDNCAVNLFTHIICPLTLSGRMPADHHGNTGITVAIATKPFTCKGAKTLW